MPGLRLDRARAKRIVRRSAAVVGTPTRLRTATSDVVLTYDDGPEPGGTDAILAALADAGVHATFFVLVTRARLYPALLSEVVAGGHDIALHGLDHRPLTDASFAEVRRMLESGRAELEDRTGRRVSWMRPPYGRQTPLTWLAIRSTGLVPVLWGPSTADAQTLEVTERLTRVRTTSAPGAILLCHDGYADSRDGVDDGPAPRLDRGDLARRVVAEYAAAGLRPCSLSEALERGSFVREAVFRR